MRKKLLVLLLMITAPPLIYVGVSVAMNSRVDVSQDYANSDMLADPPARLAQSVTIIAASINVEDPYAKPEERQSRLRAAAQQLVEAKVDVACFQGAYHDGDRAVLFDELSQTRLKHGQYYRSGMLGSGLLIVSAFPIAETFFHRYDTNGAWYHIQHGDWWLGRGAALARIVLPDDAGALDVYNTQTINDYGKGAHADDRTTQLQALDDFLRASRVPTAPVVLAGTFNVTDDNAAFNALLEEADMTIADHGGNWETVLLAATPNVHTLSVGAVEDSGEAFPGGIHMVVAELTFTPEP